MHSKNTSRTDNLQTSKLQKFPVTLFFPMKHLYPLSAPVDHCSPVMYTVTFKLLRKLSYVQDEVIPNEKKVINTVKYAFKMHLIAKDIKKCTLLQRTVVTKRDWIAGRRQLNA